MNAETILQNAIRIALSFHGVVIRMNTGVFKTTDGRTVKCGIRGLSDLIFIGHNYVAFLEVKTKTGRATPEQLNFLDRMRALGHRAGIVRSVEEAIELIIK